MRRMILLLALSLATALPAAAQVHGGSITGTVKDIQGGVLPGATITAQGVDATLSITTTADGAYHFLDLAPGSYKITAALTGFQTLIREGVIVDVGRDIDVSFAARIAAVAETVNVDAAAPIVNAKPVGTAVNFTNDELKNIPTSRDPFALIRSVPGALTDRVNVAGNETGQQLLTVAKGARPQDTSWTLDGVEITDMASIGQSAVYFNFDNFDEIHVGTAGNDVRERTGALNIDLSVKRGGNQFHGGLDGYYTGNSLQATNIPTELTTLATPVTAATSDHLTRNSDVGFDFGGPLLRDRAWFFGSYSAQNVQLFRRATNALDTTTLNDPNVKVNVQATKKDLVNFLWYNGYKIKDNRASALLNTAIQTSAATWHQDNYYSSSPLHGLFKIGDDRTFNSHLIVSAKYAYFNTGFSLTPEGGMDQQAIVNMVTSTASGSVYRSLNARPQHTGTIDMNSFFTGVGASHDLKFGGGFRTVDAQTETLYPGNGIVSVIEPANNSFGNAVEVFREGNGGNRADYLDFYAGDTITRKRVTIDLGARYDRQWGYADPSTAQGSPAFPTLLPAINFAGYRTPFTWTNISPRAGVAVSLDQSGKTVARVTYSKFASQLGTSTVGYTNTAATAALEVFGNWVDLNGDGFAEANEVNTTAAPLQTGGINTANPASPATSPNQVDPNLKAATTQSLVAGIERELMPNLAITAAYTYSRTSNLFDDAGSNITPRVGVPPTISGGYILGPVDTGTLPNGAPYSVQTYSPITSLVTAGGSGFLVTNDPGYYTDYNGLEVGIVKRMSNKWMGRASFAYNNARQHFTDPAGVYDTNGNPTPTLNEPLVNGGQFAPAENGGSGAYYLNAKWQVNLNGMYVAPYGIELAANVFGRQGYPFPIYQQTTLGKDSLTVLVTPQIDTFRYPNVWDTDARIAREFKYQSVSIRFMADVFNLFNANTALIRVNSITASNSNALTQNVTPRILRLGATIRF